MNRPYQPFREANQLLGSHRVITAELEAHGYLFVRDLFDGETITHARRDIRKLLVAAGFVEECPRRELKWSGRWPEGDLLQCTGTVGRQISELESFHNVIYAEPLLGLLRELFDGEVFSWVENADRARIQFRDEVGTTAGGQQVSFTTPAHQDGYHFPVSFVTVWVPLMDIDLATGGLTIRQGSHREGLQQHWWQGPVYLGIPEDAEEQSRFAELGGVAVAGDVSPTAQKKTWLRSDYRAGDALIFHSRMVHRGVSNRTDQLRISADLRYQRADSPTVWQANCRLHECHAYLNETRDLLNQMGLEPTVADCVWEVTRRSGPQEGTAVKQQVQDLVEEYEKGR